jgi:solute:Na+ symporter, SSS family
LISLVVSLVVTFLTRPVSYNHLKIFVEKCEPVGLWGDFHNHVSGKNALKGFFSTLMIWFAAMLMSFSGLFSIGYFILLQHTKGTLSLLVCTASMTLLYFLMNKEKKSSMK